MPFSNRQGEMFLKDTTRVWFHRKCYGSIILASRGNYYTINPEKIYKMEGIQRKELIIMVGLFFFPHKSSAHTMAINRVSFTRKFSTLILSMKRQFSICPWDEALIPWRIKYNIVILFSCQAQRESRNWRHSFAGLF